MNLKIYNYDNEKFHVVIETILIALLTNNSEPEDLLLYLFKIYVTAKNNEFKAYIQKKKNIYENDKNIILNLIGANCWDKKDPRDTRIYVLETQVQKLKKKEKQTSSRTPQTGPKTNVDRVGP